MVKNINWLANIQKAQLCYQSKLDSRLKKIKIFDF